MHLKVLRALAGPSAWVLACHILIRGSLTLASILVARGFPPADFASYSYFQLTVSAFAALASFGLGASAARHFSNFNSTPKDYPFPLGTLWLTGLLVSIVAGAVAGIVPLFISQSEMELPVGWIAAGVLFTALNVIPASAMLGLQLYRSSLLNSLLSSAILFLGLWLATSLQSLTLALSALIVSLAIQNLTDTIAVVSRVGFSSLRNSTELSVAAFGRIADLSGPLFASSLLTAAGTWVTGKLIFASDATHIQFSIYTISMQLFSLALLVPSVIAKSSLPLLVRRHDSEGPSKNDSSLWITTMFTTVAAVLFTAVVIVFAPYLKLVYGDNYEFSRPTLMLFMTAAVFSAPNTILGNQIVITGRQWGWLGITAIAMTLLVGFAWAGAKHGAAGGGLAQLVSAGAMMMLSAIAVARRNRSGDA